MLKTFLWGNVVNMKIYLYFYTRKNKQIKHMPTFIGNIAAKADAKGRIFIPSAYRKALPSEYAGRLVMRKDADNECLILYPEPVWNRKVEELKATLDEWNPTDQLLLMQFVADAEWLDIDSQGRVLIQKRYLQSIGASNELLFVGMLDRFALWNKSAFTDKRMSSTDFAALLKERMMRKENG